METKRPHHPFCLWQKPTKTQKLKAAILFSIFYFLFSSSVWAAVLYLEPAGGEYNRGDTFIAEVRIDPEEECVNTIQADLGFPKDSLEVKDISSGNSIISFWVKEPEFYNETGFISFAGGIPGGYCGKLPGDPGPSNLLGKLVFKTLNTTSPAKVEFLDSSQVLLNDGLGTSAKLIARGALYAILPEKKETPENEWQEELARDKTSPEPFEIAISRDPLAFEGKYFITFLTADKQTGLDYYEVLESRKQKIENRMWKRIESPYLLEDQSLGSIIKVKAVDKAGNERVAEWRPPSKPFPYWIIILILIGAGAIWWMIRRLKSKNQKI